MKRAFQAIALMTAYGVTPSQCFGPQGGKATMGQIHAHSHAAPLRRGSGSVVTTRVATPPSAVKANAKPTKTFARILTRCFFRASSDFEPGCPVHDQVRGQVRGHRNFGNTINDSAFTIASEYEFNEQQQYQPQPMNPDADSPALPVWLALTKSHLAYQNIDTLRQVMMESFFTNNEWEKLANAINTAADGDANKIAGACEFCLMLIETMEMGLDPLIAASFHFCSCVAAREKSLSQHAHPTSSDFFFRSVRSQLGAPSHASPASAWDLRQHAAVGSFGEQVSNIERDLAHLKRLEMVASQVAQISGVTKQRVFPDANDAGNLRKLFLTESKDWRSLAIRSAACLYRLRGIVSASDAGAYPIGVAEKRVAREALNVYAPLASRLGMQRLKNELEGVAFQILYPRQYETVSSYFGHNNQIPRGVFGRPRIQQQQSSSSITGSSEHDDDIVRRMEDVMEAVRAEMVDMLRHDPVFSATVGDDFTVTARVKHPFSLWIKMLRLGARDIRDVPDAIALRICLNGKKRHPDEDDSVTEAREKELCYYAQQLCKYRWFPLKQNPRLKDYIRDPKPNGYQSLHYTASAHHDEKSWMVEIQVRSGKMHQVAEFGLASHWDYKVRSRSPQRNDWSVPTDSVQGTCDSDSGSDAIGSSAEYLKSLQEIYWHQKDSARPDEASKAETLSSVMSSDCAESQVRAERIRDRNRQLAPYIEALKEAQSDLSGHVFVFLTGSGDSNDGKILSLPAGAMVIDAIREYQHCSGIRNISLDEAVLVNGAPASLSKALCNGDILSVPSPAASLAS